MRVVHEALSLMQILEVSHSSYLYIGLTNSNQSLLNLKNIVLGIYPPPTIQTEYDTRLILKRSKVGLPSQG